MVTDTSVSTVKVKVTQLQAVKAQTWELKYGSTVPLKSAPDLRWVANATPRPIYPGT